MASFRTTFVASVLFYISCSLIIGCAQQYEEDYSAEVRFANWQSTKTNRARAGDAPSPLHVKNSSPNLTNGNRPGTRNVYEEVTQKAQEEPLQRASETLRQGPRTRQGIRKIERRTDEVRETASERRRQNRVRTTESTTNTPEPITPRYRVPMQEAPVQLPKGFSLENRRQRVKQEPSTTEAVSLSTPRPFSRGRVKAKIVESPRKSTKDDDVSESDNYPPGFIEKLKKSEEKPPTSDITGSRRSRLRQRAAKSYPAIAISEANRFRQRYPRISSSTDKPLEEVTTEEAISRRNGSRQASSFRYTTSRTTTERKIKPFRSYTRRFTTTEKSEDKTQIHPTTISPRQKYLYSLRKGNKLLKTTTEKILEEQKKEALEPAENLFYVYPENGTPKAGGSYSEQKVKNFEGDMESEASEEDKAVDTSKETGKTSEKASTTLAATTSSTIITTSTATSTSTTTAAAPVTVNQVGASLSTRHRFSSRFSRSNRTTVSDEVTPVAPALVADIPTSAPINLTAMFDEAPDNTFSVLNLSNNSFAASSTVTNKTISPDSKTTTTRPSTVTVNSSTNSQTNTSTKRTKKKSQVKKSKKSNKATTASPATALNDRPILRNLASLFAGPETTTKRSRSRKKTSRTTRKTSTTTTTTTLRPEEISQIQSYINETMELVQNKTSVPSPNRVIPRGALNALTPETAIEDTTTQPSSTASTTTAATSTTATASSTTTTTTSTTTTTTASTTATTSTTTTPSPKNNCTSQFVFFDYNSTVPIPKQFSDVRRITATTSTTTTSTTPDYFVYGVYPNNTIVRKRAFKAFDYEKYHSPYVIFGIYPNNTIVKKFPNGTIIKDEYMTLDNEIRDIMTGSIQKTVSTTQKLEVSAGKQENMTGVMKMAGSGTTESKIEDERATTTENPDSMFEILENEIENEKLLDEGLTITTESFDFKNSEFEVSRNVTTDSAGETTTSMPLRFLEDIEETTVDSTTSTNSKESKLFYLNDIFGENILESTTEQESTTKSQESTTYASTEASTTDSNREGKSFLFKDALHENVLESTTEKTRTGGNNKNDKYFLYGGSDIDSTTERATTTESTEQNEQFRFNEISNENIVISTTERFSATTGNTREGKSSEVYGENVVESTTEKSGTTTEDIVLHFNNVFGESTTEKTGATTENTREGKSLEVYGENVVESTTEKSGTTTTDDILLHFNNVFSESTTERFSATTGNTREGKFSEIYGENVVESTTYRNEKTTENNKADISFDQSFIFGGDNFVESTTEKAGTTTTEGIVLHFNNVFGESTTEKQGKITTENEVLEYNGALSESTTEKSGKTTTDRNILDFNDLFSESATGKAHAAESSRENHSEFDTNSVENITNHTGITIENTRRGKSFDIFGENVVESTTSVTTQGKSFALNDTFTENTIDSTTEKISVDFNKEYKAPVNENSVESATEKSITTTESSSTEQFVAKLVFGTSANTERTETRTIQGIDLNNYFQPTTTRYDSSLFDIDIRSGDGPVYRPSTTEAVEASTLGRSIFGLYEEDSSISSEISTSYPLSSLTEPSTAISESNPSTNHVPSFEVFDPDIISTTERRNSNVLNEVVPINAELSKQWEINTGNTKSTIELDEQAGLINLAFRALGSSDTITPSPNYVTSTMKSMNYAEKKVRLKMKRTSTTTNKPENVFIVTPETKGDDFEFTKKGRVKFVTLTPGVIVTTNFRQGNDVMTMSSQHVQKVTKAPANLPDNILKSVVGEIQEKSSSPIPEIIKNVEKELQGNGISVSLARRIIEMAIERSVTTVTPPTTEKTYLRTEISTTSQPITIPFTTPKPETTTTYEAFNTIDLNPLSIGFAGDNSQSTTTYKDEILKEPSSTTTIKSTTVRSATVRSTTTRSTTARSAAVRSTTKSTKRTKSSRNSAAMSTLSENDKLLLEAILKQQNSELSVQEIDKIIENQIRLAEEVRKASKNLKKPRLTTTTTTTTTTQTPPLFGFLISLFSGNSSPSNIPVTRAPIKQTRSRVKSSRARGSMTNTPKSINPDPLKEADEGNSSGERSTRGELVTAAIDVTKAVSKFMGTFFSSAAQSFQAFFSNFGRGR